MPLVGGATIGRRNSNGQQNGCQIYARVRIYLSPGHIHPSTGWHSKEYIEFNAILVVAMREREWAFEEHPVSACDSREVEASKVKYMSLWQHNWNKVHVEPAVSRHIRNDKFVIVSWPLLVSDKPYHIVVRLDL